MYGPVPGLAPSPYYRLQVREEGSDSWLDTFTLLTECTAENFCNTTGVFRHLANLVENVYHVGDRGTRNLLT